MNNFPERSNVSDLEGKPGNFGKKIADGELKAAKAIIQDLLQSLKAFQLYEPNHPILPKFLDRLKQDFDGYFEKYNSLIIQVDELHFFLDETVVYESKEVRESLAFSFFKDGIREIRFFKGLNRDEIIGFLTIVRKSNNVDRMADDLVTLLWNKDFSHIEFTITEEFFEGEGLLIPLTEEELIKGLEYRGFEEEATEKNDAGTGGRDEIGVGAGRGNTLGTRITAENKNRVGVGSGTGTGIGGGLRGGTGTGAGTAGGAGIYLGKGLTNELAAGAGTGDFPSPVAEGLRQAMNLSQEKSLAQVCALDPDEIEEIYRRANKEEQLDTLYASMNNFTEIILHLGEDDKTYENIVLYFDRVLHSLLEEGEVKKAVAIFRNFRDAMVKPFLEEKQRRAIQRILQIASDSGSIELLGKVMQRNNEEDWEPVTQYLRLVGPNSIDALALMLRSLDAERWRLPVRERLIQLCREEIAPLARFLSDSKASFISDLLYILEKVRHPSTLKYLTRLIYHENSKVREEVLRLASVFQEKEEGFAAKFLSDPVPEIRGKAALAFAKTAGDNAVEPLAEIILSEDFSTRSYGEKVSFFKALGETKSAKTIPILKQIIKKKRWFKRAQWEEMRTCAAITLQMMGDYNE